MKGIYWEPHNKPSVMPIVIYPINWMVLLTEW